MNILETPVTSGVAEVSTCGQIQQSGYTDSVSVEKLDRPRPSEGVRIYIKVEADAGRPDCSSNSINQGQERDLLSLFAP